MVGVEAYAVHGPGPCRPKKGARGPAERLPDAERVVLHDADHGGTCLGARCVASMHDSPLQCPDCRDLRQCAGQDTPASTLTDSGWCLPPPSPDARRSRPARGRAPPPGCRPEHGPRAGSPHVERGFGDQAVREPEPEVARSLSYVGRGVALALQAGTALSRGLRQIRESRRTGLYADPTSPLSISPV